MGEWAGIWDLTRLNFSWMYLELCFGDLGWRYLIFGTSVGCFVKVEGGGQKGDNWGRVEEDLKDPGQVGGDFF